MSVINKMLKDLEQREQKQGADFESGSPNAVYQPKKSNNLTVILSVMFVVILALAAAVSWLLFQNTEATVEPKQVKVEPAIVAVEDKQKEQENAQPEPVVIKRSPVYVPTEIEQPTKAEQAVSTQEPTNFRTTVEASNDDADKADFSAVEVAKREPVNTPDFTDTEKSKNSVPAKDSTQQTQFKIEKTPSHLTREQRLAKLMEKAQSSFDKGYITDAITQLEEVLNSADNHVEARNLLAVAWYGRGELQQAVTILNDGLNRYPNIEKWRLTAAKIFFKENELPGAFSYLEADLPAASVEYYTMKGTLARQLQRFDKAETAYASLTKLEPNKGSWWLGHAIALDSQNKSKQAVNSYKQAIAQSGISPTSLQFAQQRIESLQE